MKKASLIVCAVSLAFAAQAMADATITQGTSAPTYATTLNFDEPGGPTGAVPSNAWTDIGITSFTSGVGDVGVGNLSGIFPWLPNSNVAEGPFGLFMTFASDLTAMSFRAWDNSGPPSPIGGGMAVILINNGDENNPVAFEIFDPAFGGLGEEYYDITTTGGTVFDEVRILGFGFTPVTYADDFSWNAIPEPGSFGLIFMAAAALVVRRRK